LFPVPVPVPALSAGFSRCDRPFIISVRCLHSQLGLAFEGTL
jgi:hypothetical protein